MYSSKYSAWFDIQNIATGNDRYTIICVKKKKKHYKSTDIHLFYQLFNLHMQTVMSNSVQQSGTFKAFVRFIKLFISQKLLQFVYIQFIQTAWAAYKSKRNQTHPKNLYFNPHVLQLDSHASRHFLFSRCQNKGPR